LALQAQYAWEMSENKTHTGVEVFARNDDEEILEFSRELYRRTIQNKNMLDEDISASVLNWEFSRIALIDRLILRMALCEILYFDEIPPKVTINEAIDLAKKYSTAESGRFVNGILDSLFKKYQMEERIHKKGRGLVDS